MIKSGKYITVIDGGNNESTINCYYVTDDDR